jgi:hypothetical protein
MESNSLPFLKASSPSPLSTGRSTAKEQLQLTVKLPTEQLASAGNQTILSPLTMTKPKLISEDGSPLIITVARSMMMLS